MVAGVAGRKGLLLGIFFVPHVLQLLSLFRPKCTIFLKVLSHSILSYFGHRKNYLYIEGNLKIILYKDRKTSKR